MVQHNFAHPLGHIVTAKYWQMVQENKLHMSVSDSGWAKFGWGKIYGQWICGAIVFAYDMDKFIPAKLLEVISKYKITTFCAPPTMYRFMLQEDLKKKSTTFQVFSVAVQQVNLLTQRLSRNGKNIQATLFMKALVKVKAAFFLLTSSGLSLVLAQQVSHHQFMTFTLLIKMETMLRQARKALSLLWMLKIILLSVFSQVTTKTLR